MTQDLYLPAVDDVRAHLADLRSDLEFPPGTLYIVVGDFHGFAGIAVFIDNVPPDQPDRDRGRLLSTSLRTLADVTPVHGALLAVRVDGRPVADSLGSSWRDAFAAAMRALGADNYGVYLVGDQQIGRVGGPTCSATE
ncbi:hypothetical protein G1H11_02910 [Phytoactinopolyspora alkaliphila]|uniref:Uncharacterized protein n=1 Tax=Phytoactinopolyspora alkaliphila TaxID=1783498 RepID=A0A6N9YH14_9ACTN|nr:hypothetical protein [Phytoactinopolyspora alkaliphila]NED94254.1 hypothetical protein [Phytoactinopolyspora alkaliphila]